jgi:hypothetical protein
MLNVDQLLNRVRDLMADRISMGAFEDWFRAESRNVHLWGDESLNQAVFEIEDVLSQYHFENRRGQVLKQELANAARRFERPVLVKIGQIFSSPSSITVKLEESKNGPAVPSLRSPVRLLLAPAGV